MWTPGRNPLTDAVLVPEVMRQEGFVWRQDRPVHLQELGRLLGKLQLLGRRPARDYLAAVGGEDAFATIRRLLDVGVLRVVAPWGYGETDHLARLAERLERAGDDRAAAVADILRGVGEDVAALRGVLGPDRGRALVALRARAEEAIGGFGVPAAEAAFTVLRHQHDDGRDGRDPLRGRGRRAPLTGSSPAPHGLPVAPLRPAARALHRPPRGGGHLPPDLVGFLSTVLDDDADGLAGVLRAVRTTRHSRGAPPAGRACPWVGPSGPPATSVLYQLAAPTLDGVRSGDLALVVNQFHAGSGSLVSRFHDLDQGELRRASGVVGTALPGDPCRGVRRLVRHQRHAVGLRSTSPACGGPRSGRCPASRTARSTSESCS